MYTLPQFPLQMVVFPGEIIPLHIFEPRYKTLILEASERKLTFGIPPVINKKVQNIGTRLKLNKIVKIYEDGRMDIRTEALGRYRIHTFYQSDNIKPYPSAEVEDLETDEVPDQGHGIRLIQLISELFNIMQVKKKVPSFTKVLSYSIGHKVGLNLAQEYELLTIDKENIRQQYLIKQLEKIIPRVVEMEELRKKIEMNGQFRHIISPDIDI
jgi:Lon protease-like protein